MAAVAVHQFVQCITCHAWSPDQSMIAFCPNNNEVHIYKLLQDKWEKLHVLQKHDQLVSGIDWSGTSNRIVSVSHDRNSFVWNQEGPEWVPTLVILRLNRAALCVQWSPKGIPLATVDPFHLRILLATTSTDGKCRVFSTFIKGVDTRESKTGSSSDPKFGEGSAVSLTFFQCKEELTFSFSSSTLTQQQILQLDLSSSWAFGVNWSPSGNTLAYVGHNSMIYFVDDVGPSPLAQNVAVRYLPLRDVLFVSEKMVIGVGFDCNPMVFAADKSGLWSFIRFLGERKESSSGPKSGSQSWKEGKGVTEVVENDGENGWVISEAFGKLYGQSRQGLSNDTVEPSKIQGAAHDNCINCIELLKQKGPKTKRFSTSGMDGKVVIWDLDNQHDLREYL
ncbi:Actin-related protein 2/3 complex subunit 1A [Hibiscus syriacus]|uniref:Arp2/3 complex 41 kDa subunit n=1 Tax=Hibiscus syriacus TaxID=106335 RepID=A0A6A2Y0E1_HIBSY|nr:Actin-related protein 2/3 complex subunit 1A [Hibiscus syriacus]